MLNLSKKYSSIMLILVCLVVFTIAINDNEKDKPAWAKKKITDYSDADMERLLDQWNVSVLNNYTIFYMRFAFNKMFIDLQENDDDSDPDDDTPEHLRPQPQIDMSQIDMTNPENLLKQSKKGRTVMAFVTVSNNPSRLETEEVTKVWQTSLWNANIQAEK